VCVCHSQRKYVLSLIGIDLLPTRLAPDETWIFAESILCLPTYLLTYLPQLVSSTVTDALFLVPRNFMAKTVMREFRRNVGLEVGLSDRVHAVLSVRCLGLTLGT